MDGGAVAVVSAPTPIQPASDFKTNDQTARKDTEVRVLGASRSNVTYRDAADTSANKEEGSKSGVKADTADEKVVIDAIENANRTMSFHNISLKYAIHEKTKQIMIKVIDQDTQRVIREIPPEKTLDMVAKMWEMAGIFVDAKK